MILFIVSSLAKIIRQMKENPKGVRFTELRKVCEHYFGTPRQTGSSHCVFRMPWPGDPRVNIQGKNGKAKPYQVRQVLHALKRLKVIR
jgi:hypothetical protein